MFKRKSKIEKVWHFGREVFQHKKLPKTEMQINLCIQCKKSVLACKLRKKKSDLVLRHDTTILIVRCPDFEVS